MNQPNYDLDSIRDPFLYRLAAEHIRLEQLSYANSDLMSYTVQKRSREHPFPPVAYRVKYYVRGIVGIDDNKMPLYGNEHELSILLPINFPEQAAECKMLTDTWHPNINSDGPFKGAICTNHAGFGSLFFLDELVVRIGEFLQYQRYLAENKAPWPEDQKVAAWVIEFGEPNGIINRGKNINTDSREWKEGIETPPEEDDLIIIEEV